MTVRTSTPVRDGGLLAMRDAVIEKTEQSFPHCE